jgi:hypothetical protein
MVAAVVRSAVIAESLQAGKGFLRHHFLGFLHSLGVVRLVDTLQNIDRHGALLAVPGLWFLRNDRDMDGIRQDSAMDFDGLVVADLVSSDAAWLGVSNRFTEDRLSFFLREEFANIG